MASFEFDNVKAEKEDALWRYNMERKLKTIGLNFCGVFSVLFLLSWSFFPTLIPDTLGVAEDFLRRFISTFNKPLFTFLLLNFIILVVYLLSNQKQTQKQITNPDIYDEYVSSRRSAPASAVSAAFVPYSPPPEETVVDKQIVLVENAVAVSPVKQQRSTVIETVKETKRSLSPVKEQPTTITAVNTKHNKPAVPYPTEEFIIKTKEYRRSRSMVSESRNQRPHREFRRSETAVGRELVVSDREPPRKSMDEMSSEEFQSIIESFIAERKKTLLQENTAHFTRRKEKEKCMSIVVMN
ncbi:hypothetical protein CCACVL1_08951 [Corchorus capsularis]|uniref:DUF4408 domain-containing protein n=1 Tax=Corchorus capsularis TaxID=210143 RepID=A0A1R3IY98_COCAP|nr:hypothetical protein CCACVL1_08951 [Corchorus capsularis]